MLLLSPKKTNRCETTRSALYYRRILFSLGMVPSTSRQKTNSCRSVTPPNVRNVTRLIAPRKLSLPFLFAANRDELFRVAFNAPHLLFFFRKLYTHAVVSLPLLFRIMFHTQCLIDHTVVDSKKEGKLKRTMEIKEQEDWRFDSSNVIRSFWRSAMEWSGIARFLCCCAYKKSL